MEQNPHFLLALEASFPLLLDLWEVHYLPLNGRQLHGYPYLQMRELLGIWYLSYPHTYPLETLLAHKVPVLQKCLLFLQQFG